jgi:hypothetical protein
MFGAFREKYKDARIIFVDYEPSNGPTIRARAITGIASSIISLYHYVKPLSTAAKLGHAVWSDVGVDGLRVDDHRTSTKRRD